MRTDLGHKVLHEYVHEVDALPMRGMQQTGRT